MRQRLRLTRYWLSGARNGVSLSELAKVVLALPVALRGRRHITSIEEIGDHRKIGLRTLDEPLYYPRQFSMPSLCVVIAELLEPAHWHYYEIEETRVKADDIVADCGAAEGLFSLIVAHRCRRVYAVEPNPRFVAAMQKTFQGVENVEIVPAALSDEEGEAHLIDSGAASSIDYSGAGIPLKVTTIDDLFRDTPVTYIKADLEGYELKVLKGAESAIRTYGPKEAITTYHGRDHASAIEEYLKKINPGYRIKTKGIEPNFGAPVMLHAWIDR